MITGAQLVFSNVPACQLDPFLVSEGRVSGEEGFLVITYPEGCHDLLFLRGKEIRIATHLRPEYRFPLQPVAVRERYRRYRSDSRTLLSFYLSPSESIRRFLSTFYYKSFLNVELDLLGRKQRQELASRMEGGQWLVELDTSPLASPPAGASPPAHLIEIQEVREREELRSLLAGMTSGRLILYDLERNLEMFRLKTQCATIHPPAGEGTSSATEGGIRPATSPVAGADRTEERRSTMSPPAPRIELAGPVRHPERGCERHFEILFRRFRKRASQLLGMKYHALEEKAEKEVQVSDPGFRLERLSGESASLVLQLMKTIVRKAPVLKRSQIRCMTITLVAEFYSSHYEVLERNNVLAAVEDFYRKLKT